MSTATVVLVVLLKIWKCSYLNSNVKLRLLGTIVFSVQLYSRHCYSKAPKFFSTHVGIMSWWYSGPRQYQRTPPLYGPDIHGHIDQKAVDWSHIGKRQQLHCGLRQTWNSFLYDGIIHLFSYKSNFLYKILHKLEAVGHWLQKLCQFAITNSTKKASL